MSNGVAVSVLVCPSCGEQALCEPSCGALVCGACSWVGELADVVDAPHDPLAVAAIDDARRRALAAELGSPVVDDFPSPRPSAFWVFGVLAAVPLLIVAGVVLALTRKMC